MATGSQLTGFLVASLGLAAGLAVMSSADLASAGDDCKYKNAPVNDVCNNGYDKKKGKSAVDAAMKDAVKAAKKAGKTIECKDCHDTSDGNKLKSDADFSKLKDYFPAAK
jgi:hypothetical protein